MRSPTTLHAHYQERAFGIASSDENWIQDLLIRILALEIHYRLAYYRHIISLLNILLWVADRINYDNKSGL